MIVITGRQLRAARALLGWEQIELARKSKVAIGTVRRMESFDGAVGARFDTLRKVVDCMEKAGIAFLDDGEPGVRLRKMLVEPKAKPLLGRAPAEATK